MENKKKTIFNVIFLLVVFAGTMYGVFHGEDIGEIVNILGQVNVLWLIPGVILQSGCKYAGYLSGKNYRKLPRKMILWCTMNREYWKV